MKKVILLCLIALAMVFSGCTDKAALKEIQDAQQEILKSQKDILAKVEALEKKVETIKTPSRRPKIDYNKVHNIPVGKSVVKGKDNAPVTIVEFSDFQCPYCSRLQPTLKQVTEAYPDKVKLVFKHFPLSFHKQARNAAKAAEAAREQGKFWEMHDMVFASYNKLTDKSFEEFAAKLGLDMDKFKADYSSNKYNRLIQDDITLARKVGVTGTPTLFMNGKRMKRRSFDEFKTGIESYMKKK